MKKINRINVIFVGIKLVIRLRTMLYLRKIIPFLLLMFLKVGIYGQSKDTTVMYKLSNNEEVEALVVNGDTFPIVNLRAFYVIAKKPVKNKRYSRRYRKLRRDVKRAYPYAKLAGMKLKEYDSELKKLKTDGQRRKFMKRVEKELRNEFENDITELTVRQGIILIKLIDRETGDTSYELVKQFRGTFSAFFWQSVARLLVIT